MEKLGSVSNPPEEPPNSTEKEVLDHWASEAIKKVHIATENGELDRALAILSELMSQSREPDALSEFANYSGMLTKQLGDHSGAQSFFRKSIAIQPNQIDAYFNLGNLHAESHEFLLAIENYFRVLELNPNDLDCLQNMHVCLSSMKDREQVAMVLAGLGELDTRHLEQGPRMVICNIFLLENWYEQCKQILLEGLRCEPANWEFWNQLGQINHRSGEYEQAEKCHLEADKIEPGNAQILSDLAAAKLMRNKTHESLDILRTLAQQQPDDANIWNNLGIGFDQSGEIDKAISCYEQAISLEPGKVESYENLGKLYAFHGETEKCNECFTNLQKWNPANEVSYKLRRILNITPIPESTEVIVHEREAFRNILNELSQEKARLTNPYFQVGVTPFFLAYQPECNKEFQSQLSRFYRQSCPDFAKELESNLTIKGNHQSRNKRIRIGFLSSFFCEHTIAKLNIGLIGLLPKDEFEVIIFTSPVTKVDKNTKRLCQLGHEYCQLPMNHKSAAEIIREAECDILHFTDIGMDPWTYFLAYYRMSPIQTTSWGHPDTTGIETLDYFISSQSIEIPLSSDQYSEKLIKFRNPPTYFQPPQILASNCNLNLRAELGISKGSKLYVCPQTLFKIHPDFDQVLEQILIRDENAHLVFISGNSKKWDQKLMSRWGHSGLATNRIHFFKRMNSTDFQAFVSSADILLDPTIFSGGVSTQEMLALKQPVVTLPGEHMRSRVTAGFLNSAGLEHLVATDEQQYVQKAIEIANNSDLKNELVNHIASQSYSIYENYQVIHEFSAFFKSAVQAHSDNSTLSGWH